MEDDRDDKPDRAHHQSHATPKGAAGPTGSPEASADRVAALEAELAAAREEVRQSNERILRERADAENLKKRVAREQGEAVRYGTERLVRDLLPIVDNLERAVQAAQGGGNGQGASLPASEGAVTAPGAPSGGASPAGRRTSTTRKKKKKRR